MAGKESVCMVTLYVVGMLITGTLNTLTTKIQFTMHSVGRDGHEEKFTKPWYGTMNMLLAMMLVGAIAQMCFGSKKTGMAPLVEEPFLSNGNSRAPSQRKKYCLVAFPAMFDLLATALCCMGMLYIPASVWQMLRGSSIIFAAIFSIMFLRREMHAFNWLGLSLCVLGIMLVGLANVMGGVSGPSNSVAEIVLGMSLVLVGQVVQAAQIIAEEWLMKDVDLPAMQIIGLEGLWGTLAMILIVYPILYILPGQDGGHLEDPIDTYVMVMNSTPLMCMVVLYLFSCGTFNATGIAVSGALTGVHRMMFDASRTMVIWAFGLFVHYQVDATSAFGEALTQYSGVQLVGFLILVLGQAVYGEVVKVPGLKYPAANRGKPLQPSPAQSLNLSSPLPRNIDG